MINKRTVVNTNKIHEEQMSRTDKIADAVANFVGSWNYILLSSALLALYMAGNIVFFLYHFDPYPYIFLNLLLAIFSFYSAPVIMMSQNRQAKKDHIVQEERYILNVKTGQETDMILERLDILKRILVGHSDEIKDELDLILESLKRNEKYGTKDSHHS